VIGVQLSNKRVLVTGAEGFIGSHLTERLVQLGAKVTALVQYNSFNNWGWIDTFRPEIRREIEVYTGDIREYDSISKAVAVKELVFHLAALIAIPYSYRSPAAYVRTNVEGTLNVMEACRIYGVEKIVHTSTSEVYGTAQYVPIDENHSLQGQSPYSASKIGADKIVESYYRSFEVPVATIRPFNTYGPRQSARAVIPTIITQILAGNEVIKLGALSPTRDLSFVKDTVEGFIRMAEVEESAGQVINIGTNREISIGDLADKIIRLTGRNVRVDCEGERLRPEKSEVNRLCCDNSRAFRVLGWSPRFTLEEGLKETIEWFKDNLHYYKADIYNI
jgi:NAD dependent epimerase/dehydratase